MNKETYIKLMTYLQYHGRTRKALIFTERALEILVIISYGGLLIYTVYTSAGFALLSAVTCLLALYICTLLRVAFNRRRPYEVYDTMPALDKDTKGKSFPSRHLTSIAVIAVNLLAINIPLGIVFLLLTAVMGTLRVLLGVHFIKDVVVGALIGIVIGVLGMYVAPIFIDNMIY